MKHVKNIILVLILCSIGAYFGHDTTYQAGMQWQDIIAVSSFISALGFIIYRYG